VDEEVFKRNENVIMCTTQHGGHLGYHTSIFDYDCWIFKPSLDFLDMYRHGKE